MTRILFTLAFLLGAAAIVWMSLTFIGTDHLALTVTLLIGFAYAIGFIELIQFRKETSTLLRALTTATDSIDSLEHWLSKLHPSLHNSVRLRVEGERVGLPAPVITPYLIGLLVMLGLLGTFLGMVDTLRGAVIALEGSSELEAVRAGLAAPIKGLGLAFGTSVAGVAASAMLGLSSTLSRRERLFSTSLLDSKIASTFRHFSLVHNRQETYKALQQQANLLPEVTDKLNTLMLSLDDRNKHVSDSLVNQQKAHNQTIKTIFTDLAHSVDQSLRESLSQSAETIGSSIKPIITNMTDDIKVTTESTQQQLAKNLEKQLNQLQNSWEKHQLKQDQERLELWSSSFKELQTLAVTEHSENSKKLSNEIQALSDKQQHSIHQLVNDFTRSSSTLMDNIETTADRNLLLQQQTIEAFNKTASTISENMTQSSEETSTHIGQLLSRSEDLVQSRIDNEAAWIESHEERMQKITSTLQAELGELRNEEQLRGQAAVERLSLLESTLTTHLSTLGNALEAPMMRLIETASETPRAAAQVIEKLRNEISNNIERDNLLLQERHTIMTELQTLSGSLTQTAKDQREAIESLVSGSEQLLKTVGSQFTSNLTAQVDKLADAALNISGSGIEISSMSEGFGAAVHVFNKSNNSLIDSLNNIQVSLDQSSIRSDEQLGYYVAQAREIIDHSILSQKEMFDQLKHLSTNNVSTLDEVS